MLDPGRNCWRVERAHRAAVVVDAADYFRLARRAMLEAKSQILLVGWDFDTRIFLDAEADDGAPGKLGPLLSWLAKHRPEVSINILKWDLGAPKLLGRGTTVLRLIRWAISKPITFKLDGAHAFGASHHQKIVIVDDKLAFCGGIDMTASRWDTRAHRDKDEGRRRPTTGRRYQPWHDATMAVDGDAARALGELARERWVIAGGAPLPAPEGTNDPWPAELQPTFHEVDVAIARTRGAHKDVAELRENEALFLDMVRRAKKFMYAESQFFASRVIAKAMAERLAEPDGPEFVIVNPRLADGWMYDEVMSPARAEIMTQLAKVDHERRFRVYTPVTPGGSDIYVHSKITIVDDELVRVGSANLNNRSMGLDTECDLLIDSTEPQNAGAGAEIAALRNDLLAEHLDVQADEVAREFASTRSLIGTIEALRGGGRSLVPFYADQPNLAERALARSELMDPEAAGGSRVATPRPGLLSGLRSAVARARTWSRSRRV
ncbi:MAG TPA: phospholipase D-like domain-containing protein [Allosphingosinicella sp.]|nr:phospholipase D-like domain-containing protein [Allosphingosinicella sp.]